MKPFDFVKDKKIIINNRELTGSLKHLTITPDDYRQGANYWKITIYPELRDEKEFCNLNLYPGAEADIKYQAQELTVAIQTINYDEFKSIPIGFFEIEAVS